MKLQERIFQKKNSNLSMIILYITFKTKMWQFNKKQFYFGLHSWVLLDI